ncbi:MAG TPA: hypothetical protein VMO52_08885 [Acidimicrobiia bacterium]|nr:hypothetical protein [Acidimicrobiia bacterium]
MSIRSQKAFSRASTRRERTMIWIRSTDSLEAQLNERIRHLRKDR